MTNIFMFVFTGEIFEDYCLTETIDEIGNMPLHLVCPLSFESCRAVKVKELVQISLNCSQKKDTKASIEAFL